MNPIKTGNLATRARARVEAQNAPAAWTAGLGMAMLVLAGLIFTIMPAAAGEAEAVALEIREVQGRNADRIWVPRIRDWQDVDRESFVIYGPVNKDPYLVKVWPTCTGLRFTDTIGYTTTNNYLTKFDSVIVRGQRCPIESITPITVEQARALTLDEPDQPMSEAEEIDG